jgi:hypothetical protein
MSSSAWRSKSLFHSIWWPPLKPTRLPVGPDAACAVVVLTKGASRAAIRSRVPRRPIHARGAEFHLPSTTATFADTRGRCRLRAQVHPDSTSESDLRVILSLPRVHRVLVLLHEYPPALDRNLEVSHSSLRTVESHLGPPQLVLRILEVRPQEVALGPLALVEFGRMLAPRPVVANHVSPIIDRCEVAFAPTRRRAG